MKILLDHCIDWRLKRSLLDHDVKSAKEIGWDELENGELLLAARGESFDVMLTVDRHLSEQQNLSSLPVAVIVVMTNSNRLSDVLPFIPAIEVALKSVEAGELIQINKDMSVRVIPH